MSSVVGESPCWSWPLSRTRCFWFWWVQTVALHVWLYVGSKYLVLMSPDGWWVVPDHLATGLCFGSEQGTISTEQRWKQLEKMCEFHALPLQVGYLVQRVKHSCATAVVFSVQPPKWVFPTNWQSGEKRGPTVLSLWNCTLKWCWTVLTSHSVGNIQWRSRRYYPQSSSDLGKPNAFG